MCKEIVQERPPFDVAWQIIDGLKVPLCNRWERRRESHAPQPLAREHLRVRPCMGWAEAVQRASFAASLWALAPRRIRSLSRAISSR